MATKKIPAKTTKKPAPNAAAKSPAKRKKKKGAELKAHALEILKRLKAEYPDAHCELDFQTPLQLLTATILRMYRRSEGRCRDVVCIRPLAVPRVFGCARFDGVLVI